MSELEPNQAEQEQAFSAENAWQFLGWMFEDLPPERFAEVPESYLPVMFDVLEQNAIDRYEQLPPVRQKKQLLAPLDLLRRWKQGESYDLINQQTGLSEDRFRFSLISYAYKLGKIETLEGLLASTQDSIEKAAAMAEQAQQMSKLIVQEELQAIPEPEQEALEESEQEPAPKPEPEKPIVQEPLSGEEVLDTYPLLSRLSSDEELQKMEEILRQAGKIK